MNIPEELLAGAASATNCDVFRARIAELEDLVLSLQCKAIEIDDLRAELAAIKAQGVVDHFPDATKMVEAKAHGVVMPEAEDFCFCGKHVSLQMISGGASKHGYLGSVTLLIDGKYIEYTRLNAVPVRQVSVADAGLVEALEKLARLGNGDKYGNSEGNFIAQAAIAAHRAKGVV